VAWGIVALALGYVLSLNGKDADPSTMWTWNIYGYFLGMLCFVLALYFSDVPIPQKTPKKKAAISAGADRRRQTSLNFVDDDQEDGMGEEEVHVVDHQKEDGVVELGAEGVELTPLQEIRLLLSSFKVCCYLFTVFIMGMGSTLIGSFLFLFLQDLGGTRIDLSPFALALAHVNLIASLTHDTRHA
jgi:hypothetical protein